jgi:hexosaminidase
LHESIKFNVKIGSGELQSHSVINNGSNTQNSSRIINEAIARTTQTIFKHNFVPWKFHPRHARFEPSTIQMVNASIRSINLHQSVPDPSNIMRPLANELDESYNLTISVDGDIAVVANTSIGIVYGLTTLTQLFFRHSEGAVYTPYAPVIIIDSPEFAHRGLNLDLARNYIPVKSLMKTINAMAYSKFNRFHLHITDAQSWPLESLAFPELAQKGAYHAGLTYSPTDIRALQEHGALQGVQVFLEIDMPGHTSSIWYSHPELIAAFNEQPNWSFYSVEPPSGTMKLNSTKVYDFLEKLFQDLLPRVSPYTAYFHTGGDEVNMDAYLDDETVRSTDVLVLQPLMQKFVDRNHAQVRAAGLTPIVWEEMVFEWNLKLGKDVVVQTWQGSSKVALTASYGYKVIAGNSDFWVRIIIPNLHHTGTTHTTMQYLDCGKGQWLNSVPEAGSSSWPYDACSPRQNWRTMYGYDPLLDVPDDQKHLVIGGEAHIWTEQIDSVNLDGIIWPRAAAVAEVLWSGAKNHRGENRSLKNAEPRLAEMRERLLAMGIKSDPVQMPFCLMEPGQCYL